MWTLLKIVTRRRYNALGAFHGGFGLWDEFWNVSFRYSSLSVINRVICLWQIRAGIHWPSQRKLNGLLIHGTELYFEWKIDGDKSPIEYSEGLGMSDFMQGVKFVKYNCTAEYSTGPFSCLQGYFVLDRQVGYYLLWAFLPSGTVSRNFLSDEIRLQLKK